MKNIKNILILALECSKGKKIKTIEKNKSYLPVYCETPCKYNLCRRLLEKKRILGTVLHNSLAVIPDLDEF